MTTCSTWSFPTSMVPSVATMRRTRSSALVHVDARTWPDLRGGHLLKRRSRLVMAWHRYEEPSARRVEQADVGGRRRSRRWHARLGQPRVRRAEPSPQVGRLRQARDVPLAIASEPQTAERVGGAWGLFGGLSFVALRARVNNAVELTRHVESAPTSAPSRCRDLSSRRYECRSQPHVGTQPPMLWLVATLANRIEVFACKPTPVPRGINGNFASSVVGHRT